MVVGFIYGSIRPSDDVHEIDFQPVKAIFREDRAQSLHKCVAYGGIVRIENIRPVAVVRGQRSLCKSTGSRCRISAQSRRDPQNRFHPERVYPVDKALEIGKFVRIRHPVSGMRKSVGFRRRRPAVVYKNRFHPELRRRFAFRQHVLRIDILMQRIPGRVHRIIGTRGNHRLSLTLRPPTRDILDRLVIRPRRTIHKYAKCQPTRAYAVRTCRKPQHPQRFIDTAAEAPGDTRIVDGGGQEIRVVGAVIGIYRRVKHVFADGRAVPGLSDASTVLVRRRKPTAYRPARVRRHCNTHLGQRDRLAIARPIVTEYISASPRCSFSMVTGTFSGKPVICSAVIRISRFSFLVSIP